MTELEELRLAYAECSRQRNELLAKLKTQAQQPSQYGSPELQFLIVTSAIQKDKAEQPAQQEFECPRCGHCCPPQRKQLTLKQREAIAESFKDRHWTLGSIIDAVEAAHGIKENT